MSPHPAGTHSPFGSICFTCEGHTTLVIHCSVNCGVSRKARLLSTEGEPEIKMVPGEKSPLPKTPCSEQGRAADHSQFSAIPKVPSSPSSLPDAQPCLSNRASRTNIKSMPTVPVSPHSCHPPFAKGQRGTAVLSCSSGPGLCSSWWQLPVA